jgi:hypothetical protein
MADDAAARSAVQQIDTEGVRAAVSEVKIQVKRGYEPREEKLPVAADTEFWAPKCKPLHSFLLGERKSWPQILDWARENHVTHVRNMLAWLELHGLANGDGRGWIARPYDSR